MNIVHICSEVTPIAKVGGLADFVQGLSASLSDQENQLSVVLPFYASIDRSHLRDVKVALRDFSVTENLASYSNTVWSAQLENFQVFLLKPNHPKRYFDRKAIYGEKDDIERFGYFSHAALEYLLQADIHPDILHLHDWITGGCAPLYYEMYRALGLRVGAVITTLHNLCYQGVCRPEQLSQMGLKNPDHLLTVDKLQDPSKPSKGNLLKGAIVYSDQLTTVSPSYCQEIKTKKGFGLEPLLTRYNNKLTGILNGIDADYWNPSTDPHLAATYPATPHNIEAIVAAKKKNRLALAKKVGLKPNHGPLVASITRLVTQKGPDLIRAALEETLSLGGQSVLLGSAIEDKFYASFCALQDRYQKDGHSFFFFDFDEPLAHLTFAAADILLVPSLFEPCGLTQMIALRYGTIPIVHHVGGLKDTIIDADHHASSRTKPNGYTFSSFSVDHLIDALHRACTTFHKTREKWHQLMINGMSQDWSWKRSAFDYLKLYHFATTHRQQP